LELPISHNKLQALEKSFVISQALYMWNDSMTSQLHFKLFHGGYL
jgi:hypothetical protein